MVAMKILRLILVLCLLGCFRLAAQTVYFPWNTFNLSGNFAFLQTTAYPLPTNSLNIFGTNGIGGDWTTVINNSSGVATFTPMVPGSYLIVGHGPQTLTSFQITVTNGTPTNAVVNGFSILTTNVPNPNTAAVPTLAYLIANYLQITNLSAGSNVVLTVTNGVIYVNAAATGGGIVAPTNLASGLSYTNFGGIGQKIVPVTSGHTYAYFPHALDGTIVLQISGVNYSDVGSVFCDPSDQASGNFEGTMKSEFVFIAGQSTVTFVNGNVTSGSVADTLYDITTTNVLNLGGNFTGNFTGYLTGPGPGLPGISDSALSANVQLKNGQLDILNSTTSENFIKDTNSVNGSTLSLVKEGSTGYADVNFFHSPDDNPAHFVLDGAIGSGTINTNNFPYGYAGAGFYLESYLGQHDIPYVGAGQIFGGFVEIGHNNGSGDFWWGDGNVTSSTLMESIATSENNTTHVLAWARQGKQDFYAKKLTVDTGGLTNSGSEGVAGGVSAAAFLTTGGMSGYTIYTSTNLTLTTNNYTVVVTGATNYVVLTLPPASGHYNSIKVLNACASNIDIIVTNANGADIVGMNSYLSFTNFWTGKATTFDSDGTNTWNIEDAFYAENSANGGQDTVVGGMMATFSSSSPFAASNTAYYEKVVIATPQAIGHAAAYLLTGAGSGANCSEGDIWLVNLTGQKVCDTGIFFTGTTNTGLLTPPMTNVYNGQGLTLLSPGVYYAFSADTSTTPALGSMNYASPNTTFFGSTELNYIGTGTAVTIGSTGQTFGTFTPTGTLHFPNLGFGP